MLGAEPYALGGLAQAVRSGWQRAKNWFGSLLGRGRENDGFATAARELYDKCDMRSRARGGVRFEDDD